MTVYKTLRFSQEALADMNELYNFIAADDAVAARNVVEKIYHACINIETFPLAGRRGSVTGTREFVIPGTRYILVYKITKKYVIIIGLYHTAMNR